MRSHRYARWSGMFRGRGWNYTQSTHAVEHRARERAFRERRRVEQHHPQAARHPDPRRVAAEQPHETVREGDAGTAIARAPRAIARKHCRRADRVARRIADRLRELERVAKAEIEALSRDRV